MKEREKKKKRQLQGFTLLIQDMFKVTSVIPQNHFSLHHVFYVSKNKVWSMTLQIAELPYWWKSLLVFIYLFFGEIYLLVEKKMNLRILFEVRALK